ncbi:hypothetical protein G647_07748 [Cladophialophora carrionii CBS 160.54]|uniref:Heterokaryon incompatibility domain-containing protein n=1 Tax=Cladophialophora carrionii CBS 160.54 TaxID=1279043 RepID=V9D434_9EURO|nr:uncharacterized protein G647_07748 [Cladophialophora carrionii CBS 160.54]ETI21401.1 hypothetical protein G647_07748 [Cladophialophora carrionii CBS 160.54]
MAKNLQFCWQPLPHPTKNIRLIELLSAKSKDAPIQLKLATYSINGYCPSYEAISYTWGDAVDEEEIIMGGEDGQSSRKLRVRKNLYDCLKRLRQTTSARYLWVDAICIDQRNNDEKGAQVSIMGKIFSGAERVLVWLGEVDDGSDTILAKATKRKWWAFGASFCIPTTSKKRAAHQMSESPTGHERGLFKRSSVPKPSLFTTVKPSSTGVLSDSSRSCAATTETFHGNSTSSMSHGERGTCRQTFVRSTQP